VLTGIFPVPASSLTVVDVPVGFQDSEIGLFVNLLIADRDPSSLMAATPSREAATTSTHAFLSSFYIYNPSLGKTDITVADQLIFHYSPPSTTHKTASPKPAPADSSTAAAGQDLDKQLRAIGLAQGIVEFARAFSPDSPLQEVRTQKGFTVPLEVEKGWWMLAVTNDFEDND
jgi:hypothetical protein